MKSANYQLDAVRFVAETERELRALGIQLECSTDFERFAKLCRTMKPGAAGATEPFDLALFDIWPDTAFWIGGRDEQGEIVHLQAIRHDSLGELTLAQSWQQQLRRIFCDPNPGAKLRGTTAPAATQITGQVCYHGDMWIADHMRRQGLSGKLSRFALGLALLTWAPDFVYAFAATSVVVRAAHIRMGYMHQQPEGVIWKKPPAGLNADDWIVWLTFQDLIYLIKQDPKGL